MKFEFKISKLANQFFFISNLNEWSPYCREEYNQLWLKNNPLNKEEKKVLLNIKILLKKHDISKIFLSSSQPTKTWKAITSKLDKNNLSNLKKSLNVFLPRFNKLWQNEKKNLILIKKNLSTEFNSKKILFLFKILFGQPIPNSINIFLITNPITNMIVSGGQGLGKNKIAVECSKLTRNNNPHNQVERVILHEIIHASFQNKIVKMIKTFVQRPYFIKNYKNILSKSFTYKQTKSFIPVINEMILVSLLPEGYLAEKYFGLNVIKNLRKRKAIRQRKLTKNYYDLMLFSVWKLYPIAKKYCNLKKPIDNLYIEESIKCWADFEKQNLSKLKI